MFSSLEIELQSQSIDYETINTENYKFAVRPFHSKTKIFSYSIGKPNGAIAVRRLDYKDERINKFNYEQLIEFWKNSDIHKISHNSKFEYTLTKEAGIEIPEDTIIHDTMIQSQILRNLHPQHGLASLCYELQDPELYTYRGKRLNSKELDKLVSNEGKRLQGYNKIEKNLFNMYQVADSIRPILLHNLMFPVIYQNKKLLKDYFDELELIRVTYQMEKTGIRIDIDKCNELIDWLDKELMKLPHEVEKELGYFVNLGSDKTVAHILFNQFKLPIISFTETGAPSTDKDTILELRELFPEHNNILSLILKHRSYTKGKANILTYIDFSENGIIHPNIKTNGAHRTGRQSSSDPNLQNLEKEKSTKNLYPVPARYCMVCHESSITLSVDFDAIELRLILEAAQSTRMIDNLKNGISPHVIFCGFVYGKHVPKEKQFIDKKKSSTLYDSGKNGHFCLCYGGSLKKLSQTLLLTIEDTKIGRQLYKNEYPEIVDLIKNGIEKIKEIGFVETAFGRQLKIEQDKLYSWLNFYIQGTAAGILKRAQVNVTKYLNTNFKNSGISIILTVHDELFIKFPKSLIMEIDKIVDEISNIMITVPEITVPLKVAFKYTKNSFAEMKPLILE